MEEILMFQFAKLLLVIHASNASHEPSYSIMKLME